MITTWLSYPGDATLKFPFYCATRAMEAFRRLLYKQTPGYLDNADLLSIVMMADFLLLDAFKEAAIAVMAKRLRVFSFREEEWSQLMDMAVAISVPPLHFLLQ